MVTISLKKTKLKPCRVDLPKLCEKSKMVTKTPKKSSTKILTKILPRPKTIKQRMLNYKLFKELNSNYEDDLFQQNSSNAKLPCNLLAENSSSESEEESPHDSSSSSAGPVRSWPESSSTTPKALKHSVTRVSSLSQIAFVHKKLLEMSKWTKDRKSQEGNNVMERKASKTVLFKKLLDQVKLATERKGNDYDEDDDDDESKTGSFFGDDEGLFV